MITPYPKFAIEECYRGTGGPWGALRLDEEFRTLLRLKLESHADVLLTPNRTSDLMRDFDTHIKARFNPYDNPREDKFPIPFTGAADIPDVGLQGEYLFFTKYYRGF